MLLLVVSLPLMLLVYRESTEAFITGVGWRSDGDLTWTAPRDPLLRWDTDSTSSEQVEVSVMQRGAVRGAYGFLLHDACWKILQKASEPTGLSLERLVSVCEALPFPLWYNGLSWGHDYGGLLSYDVDGQYPWLEWFCGILTERIYDSGAYHDPFNGIGLPITFSTPIPRYVNESSYLKKSTDCFVQLPWELRELIAVYLPTKSALSLREASWSFLNLFSSSAFWSSRFEPDGERDFIFEVRETKKARTTDDLISLYRFSKCSADSPSILNRNRVWTLARKLAVIIEPVCANDIPVRQESSPACEGRVRLAGQEQPSVPQDEWKAFNQGCRSITTTELDIPNGPLKIGITTIDMGDWDYVTGIRILDPSGGEQIIGHRSTKHETVCDVTTLHGFKVAMGPGGVRALQVIGRESQGSGWVGRINGVPRSERLLSEEPISTLSISLDVSDADLLTKYQN